MEHAYSCKCGHRESWTTAAACQAAAEWHIWETHPDLYAQYLGEGPPQSPKPETLGTKFEGWESQLLLP